METDRRREVQSQKEDISLVESIKTAEMLGGEMVGISHRSEAHRRRDLRMSEKRLLFEERKVPKLETMYLSVPSKNWSVAKLLRVSEVNWGTL